MRANSSWPRTTRAVHGALDAIDAEHGGIDAYLTEVAGMTPAALARLRAALVEPG